eukprot:TRINITY_DN28031_c0_g1_i1.p1 TRINITY_DN28031_c0_g1~~TRINITY_DN28031_c0_g1_i1.p1  ORF type:complete len:182 (-),score=47.81 TRINITY_DN28031_c0_g1_i1:50-595(-)
MDQLQCNDAAQDLSECPTEDYGSVLNSNASQQGHTETHEEEAAHGGGSAPEKQLERSQRLRSDHFPMNCCISNLASLTIQEEPCEDDAGETQLNHSPCVLDYGLVMSASMKEVASVMMTIAATDDDEEEEEEEESVGIRRSQCRANYVVTRSIRQLALQKLEEEDELGEVVASSTHLHLQG